MSSHLSKSLRGFTLIEVMVVVVILGVLVAIATPSFLGARETARAKSCADNLHKIDGAKQQCAMDNKLPASSPVSFAFDGTTASSSSTYQLVASNGSLYLRSVPACPSGGTYTAGVIPATPTCTVATAATDPNYQGPSTASSDLAGRYYHGL